MQIEKLCFAFQNQPALFQDLNLDLDSHDRVGIIGETGSGKTTLLKIIMGLIPTKSSFISLFGKKITTKKDFEWARLQIGYLFQHADDQLFSPTVMDDVLFGPLNQGLSGDQARNRADEALKEVGIIDLADHVISKLSGGEKKLVALATILAMKPKLLMMDEPVTGIDPDTKKRVIKIIQNFAGPIIVISHDWNFLEKITNKIYKLEDRRLVFNGQMKIHKHTHIHPMGDVDHEHGKIDID